jgi:Kef-type K+ transport system membrane component KefB
MKKIIIILVVLGSIITPQLAYASGKSVSHSNEFSLVFLFVVILLLAGRIGALAERFRQPSVLGELIMGMILGVLALLPGLHGILDLACEPIVVGIAEIGVLLLLFRTGLETNLHDMKSVGVRALAVAVVGVVLPFVGGFLAIKILMPGMSNNTSLFFGATLTATSVGITTRVFKDLNILKTIEAQIVLGAAVIDDVLGLLILGIITGIVSSGHVELVTVVVLCVKAFVFFVGAIFFGRLLAPRFGVWLSRIHPGSGMKMALALVFCGVFSYAASALAGLAPIVGAFTAGLILDPVHFKSFNAPLNADRLRAWANQLRCVSSEDSTDIINEMEDVVQDKEQMHLDSLIEGMSNFFIPIFFVYTGLQVNFSVFCDIKIVCIALVITAIAFIGKIACGYAAGKTVDCKLIGFGMVPRGEVGLIFLNVGKKLGVVSSQTFAIGVIMVVLTTLFTPPILNMLVRKRNALNKALT